MAFTTKQELKSLAKAGGILLIAFAIFMGLDWWQMSKLRPRQGEQGLARFAATMPPPRNLELRKVNGGEFIVWTGEGPGLPAIPSGPPVYAFDLQGHLIFWTEETGEGPPEDGGYRGGVLVRKLSVDEALALIARADTGSSQGVGR